MGKYLLKTCSILLVVVLLVNMLPMSVFAEEFQESITTEMMQPDEKLEMTTQTDAQIVSEIASKRTQYTKEFILSNGLHLAAVYPDAVHYEENGEWAEIDNTLTLKNGKYVNTAGVWNVSFPQQLSGSKSVTIEKDGYTLSFAMAGELRNSGELMTAAVGTATTEQLSVSQMQLSTAAVQPLDKAALQESYQYAEMAPEKLYSRLSYADVYQNTDVIYDMDSNRVKESIVMEAYSSTLRGYKYTLNVGQMIPVLEDDGQITFYDAEQENIVMVMPAPYLVDAAEESSWDIRVQLTGSNGVYTLTYLLPTQWLADSQRAWPVILDPVVTPSLATTNIKDDTVSEKNEYGYKDTALEAGHSNDHGISRIYLMYEELPHLASSDVIIAATVQLYKKADGLTVPLEVHKVNNTWTSSTINWSNMPGYNQTIEDYAMVGDKGAYTWSITDIVRDWYANKNTGMMFKVSDEVEAAKDNRYKRFHSSDQSDTSKKPILAIVFRNNNGLEGYWDYTSSTAGRAGTGYINNYTGNLTWIRDDIGFGGNVMPVSIQHVYNLNDATKRSGSDNTVVGNNRFYMGYGWRTNYNQLVYQWSTNSNYYVWEDADGMDHYFLKESNGVYKDEDGLELTLTTTGSGTEKYCIADKNGNRSYFDTHGRLRTIKSKQRKVSRSAIPQTPEPRSSKS